MDPDVALLEATPLFDPEWYAAGARCSARSAVEAYLAAPLDRRADPHPLVDRDVLGRGLRAAGLLPEGTDPFLAWLRSGEAGAAVRPHLLFDAEAYLASVPEAEHLPGGPLEHYIRQGAAAGLRPNAWYRPDPQSSPGGLVDWARQRGAEWAQRQAAVPRPTRRRPPDPSELVPDGGAAVSVVVVVGDDLEAARASARSALGSAGGLLELLLVHRRDPGEVEAALSDVLDDPRARAVRQHRPGRAAAVTVGLALARGRWVGWLSGGDRYEPHALARAVAAAQGAGARACAWAAELRRQGDDRRWFLVQEPTPERLRAGLHLDLSRTVVDRALLVVLGGLDESLPAAWDDDLVLAVALSVGWHWVPGVGSRLDEAARHRDERPPLPRERPLLDLAALPTWGDVARSRRLVDWPALGRRRVRADTTSVLVHAPATVDAAVTTRTVEHVLATRPPDRRVEVVVVATGSPRAASVTLDASPARSGAVRVVHTPVEASPATAVAFGLDRLEGERVVLVPAGIEVLPGWLDPLLSALEDPDVLGAAPLVLDPDGTIASAGTAFPSCGGAPHDLLAGFPHEDAARLGGLALAAPDRWVVALRRTDLVALRGLDPLLRTDLAVVDLALRARRARPAGRFVLRPESAVVRRHPAATASPLSEVRDDVRVLLQRWAAELPGDDGDLWAAAGFDVVRHETGPEPSELGDAEPPRPVLVRRPAVAPDGRPSLRWSIADPAYVDASGARRGSTLSTRLAAALRRLGQDVVVDAPRTWHRSSGALDDVVVVLRGAAPYAALPGRTTLLWVVSDAESVPRREAEAATRVLAADEGWVSRVHGEWALDVDHLPLDAIDGDADLGHAAARLLDLALERRGGAPGR